jgi:hypothetical protein
MSFRISALPLARFAPLFSLSDHELAARNVVRRIADRKPGFPCRVSLRDADPGERVLLINYEHQSANSPYRSTHAIYVRENADQATPAVDEVPVMLRMRLLSVRAFDAKGFMLEADLVDGEALESTIERMFANPEAEYIHLHNAKPGCYAARVDRVA